MGCGGKDSVEKITEALIKKVIQEELKDIPLEDDPFLTPDAVEVKNEQKEELEREVSAVVHKVVDKVKDDEEIQDGIKRIASILNRGGIEEANKTFKAVFNQLFKTMFQDGITWLKIVSLLYVVGRVVGIMVDRMVTALRQSWMDLCQSVKAILNLIVDFFKKYLLGWILEQGGWIRCLALP
ncbi:apoptosis regulator BAX-like isoform X2 [Hippoglossus hippoglossus]|uniref:apoptosis regulator BAX-like isoform X2 n=1 Tax=Hippoglossus hippoglossus TaxID=8267 RepID=UPI00148CDB9B|nr:apoptosis regulator BAX-like isoform X2 [Hippoglossus hippoglossus]